MDHTEEIDRLARFSLSEIRNHWIMGSPPFQMVRDDESTLLSDCGCLTMIRGEPSWKAFCNKKPHIPLTMAIRSDERIPGSGANMRQFIPDWDRLSVERRKEILTACFEWQDALDATIRSGKPWHPEFAPSRAPANPKSINSHVK